MEKIHHPPPPSFYFKYNSSDFRVDPEWYQHELGIAGFQATVMLMIELFTLNPTIIMIAVGSWSEDEKKGSKLAMKRAQKTRDLLVQRGIPKERIKVDVRKQPIQTTEIKNELDALEQEHIHGRMRSVRFLIESWDYVP